MNLLALLGFDVSSSALASPKTASFKAFRTVVPLAMRAAPRAAFAGLYWFLRGKRVRGWNMICLAAAQSESYYERWVEVTEAEVVRRYCQGSSALADNLVVSCIILSDRDFDAEAVARSLASIRAALGVHAPVWASVPEMIGCQSFGQGHSASIEDALLELPAGGWLLPIKAGDLVSPLLRQALDQAIAKSGNSEIIFWDEDQLQNGRRTNPWIKPDWDDILFLALDTVSGSSILSTRAALDMARTMASERLNPKGIAHLVTRMARQEEGGRRSRAVLRKRRRRRRLPWCASASPGRRSPTAARPAADP